MTQKVTNKIGGEERTFIYFVRSGEFIKIGQSKTWKRRIANMQIGSPHTIITLLVLIGEPKLESKLHNWFRADHFRGEWFHSGPAILAYIREHLSECVAKSDEHDLRTPPRNEWDDALVL
jgi:hypothetical protein